MRSDDKIRWFKAIIEHIMNGAETPARLGALPKALQAFTN
jgi:hypothetical protein